LRLVAERLLPQTAGKTYVDKELAGQRLNLLPPPTDTFHIYCSRHNLGAATLIEELARELGMTLQMSDKAEHSPVRKRYSSLQSLMRDLPPSQASLRNARSVQPTSPSVLTSPPRRTSSHKRRAAPRVLARGPSRVKQPTPLKATTNLRNLFVCDHMVRQGNQTHIGSTLCEDLDCVFGHAPSGSSYTLHRRHGYAAKTARHWLQRPRRPWTLVCMCSSRTRCLGWADRRHALRVSLVLCSHAWMVRRQGSY
jgi:hypothetical protein